MVEINSIIGRRVAPLLQSWSTPRYQNFDWGVAGFAAGIAIYFALPFEPQISWVLMILGLLSALIFLVQRFFIRLYSIVLIGVLLFLGIGYSAWHTQSED